MTKRLSPSGELRRARAILEAGWCQGANARNAAGSAVPIESKNATCHCANGAMWKPTDEPENTNMLFKAETYLTYALRDMTEGHSFSIIEYNDAEGRTKEDVLAVFDKAIADAEANGE